MTTANEIITQAFRERNTIAVGAEPTDAEVAEALLRLNSVVRNVFGRVVGEHMRPWEVPSVRTSPVSARYPLSPYPNRLTSNQFPYPPQNRRVYAKPSSATTIYFPPEPNAGAQMALVGVGADFASNPLTIDANGRLIEGGLTKTVSEALSAPLHWFYRDDTASWTPVISLTLTDELYFPEEYDDYFIIELAMRLSGRFGKDPTPYMLARREEVRRDMKTRYHQEERVQLSPDPRTFNTEQSYGNFIWDSGVEEY